MTADATQDNLLLVALWSVPPDLGPLINELAQSQVLDRYTLRQRLLGQGLSQLHKGPDEQLRPLKETLQRHHLQHWVLTPAPAMLFPQAITGLQINTEAIVFDCQQQRFTLHQNSQPLIVVADLSGQIAGRILKRQRVQQAHTGQIIHRITPTERQQEIFKLSPVIDLYWGQTPDRIDYAVRITAGKFDHRQLGERAELSRNRNLAALLDAICTLCPQHHLDTGYGLGFLPDYPVKEVTEGASHHKGNLATLTRYGNLLLTLAHSRQGTSSPESNTALSALTENPAVAASLTAGLSTVLGSDPQATATEPLSGNSPPATPTLPPPPPPQTRSGLQLHLTSWRLALSFGSAALVVISEGRHSLPNDLYHYTLDNGLLPAVVSGLCLWNALYYWRLKRRIENTPTSKARSAAMGMIEVHGRARRQYALVSPSTQVPCVYYCRKKYRRSGKDGNWRLVSVTSSDNVPFILEDDTGRITIEPDKAVIKPKVVHDDALSDTSSREKWREEVIYEGSEVYVMGFARSARKGHDSLRQRVAEKLRHLKTDRQALLKYDHNDDGSVDAAEWERARTDMEQQALQDKLLQGQQRSNQQLVIGAPPQQGLPFIIAETASETDLTQKYSWYVPPLLVAGLGCFAWALARAARFFHLF